MNFYLILVLVLITGNAALDALLDLLSLKQLSNQAHLDLPQEFQGVYDPNKYKDALKYQATNYRFHLVSAAVDTPLIIAFIVLGGFNLVDNWARSFHFGSVATGLVFVGVLATLRSLMGLPFSIYKTFVIEEKFGFNKTTPRTFIEDLFKGLVIGAVLGGAIFAGILWFFQEAGPLAWLYAWAAFTAVQLILVYLAPILFLPLFNQFKPLEHGELKTSVDQYNEKNHFQMSGIFTMDGSKRSTKANAFFTGFGKFKRLVLFDTLLEKNSTDELMAVFAHEAGHFKLGHIIKRIWLSFFMTLGMFFLFSLFINNEGLFAAFKMDQVSIYASLVIVGFLFSPISRASSLLSLYLSRKAEFEADRYSAETFGRPDAMITALKKLSIDNLSDLKPHWLKVIFDYTHPPVLQRIEALQQFSKENASVRRIR
jgi:STE24 endopeptidase